MALTPTTVDEYLDFGCGRCELGGTPNCKVQHQQHVLSAALAEVRSLDLEESIHWGVPCFSLKSVPILLLAALEEGVCISFFRGSKMHDLYGQLQIASDTPHFMRHILFTSLQDLHHNYEPLKYSLEDAVELEIASRNEQTGEFNLPQNYSEAFRQVLSNDPVYRIAFDALPTDQQVYISARINNMTSEASITSYIYSIREQVLSGNVRMQ